MNLSQRTKAARNPWVQQGTAAPGRWPRMV